MPHRHVADNSRHLARVALKRRLESAHSAEEPDHIGIEGGSPVLPTLVDTADGWGAGREAGEPERFDESQHPVHSPTGFAWASCLTRCNC